MKLIAHVTAWQKSILVSHPRSRGYIFMNTVFIMQKFLLRHHSLYKQAPGHTELTCYTHPTEVAHSSQENIPYVGSALIAGTVDWFIFTSFQWGCSFCHGVCILWEVQAISLPNPVTFSLLAFLCQRASICDLWFCWCPIRQFRFRFFPSSRYFMADAQMISSMLFSVLGECRH